jgi:hypothetical protein
VAARSRDYARRGLPAVPASGPAADPPVVPHSLRARLTVIAPGLADVVPYAGGWLFDQAMAGWDVAVLTAGQADPRPLRILGARGYDLETVLAMPLAGRCLRAIAVEANLYRSDARVRRMVYHALDRSLAEVRLWGGGWPEDLDVGTRPVRHKLSAAARAFKAQALAAAAAPDAVSDDVEEFRTGRIGRPGLVGLSSGSGD